MKASQVYVGLLLGMLSALVVFHLILLNTGLRQCDDYQRILIERLRRVTVGSPEALAIRKELQEYFIGKTTECAQAEETFQSASDKYVATLLALLTGAGVAVGISANK
jgi:hypothetical protein